MILFSFFLSSFCFAEDIKQEISWPSIEGASKYRIEVAPKDDFKNSIDVLTKELNKIVHWVEQLNEVDVEGVEPMTGVSGMSLREREDNVLDGGYAEKIVMNSEEKKNNSFSVPKVIE